MGNSEDPNLDEYKEDKEDVDVSMAIDADADDLEAMAAITVTDYDPGDTLGKLMAFVNQLRMSSELTCNYLVRMCIMQNVKPIELLLWIQTRWGSLTHCLEATLSIQKVSLPCLQGCLRGHNSAVAVPDFSPIIPLLCTSCDL